MDAIDLTVPVWLILTFGSHWLYRKLTSPDNYYLK